jgi:hypothetical protein
MNQEKNGCALGTSLKHRPGETSVGCHHELAIFVTLAASFGMLLAGTTASI